MVGFLYPPPGTMVPGLKTGRRKTSTSGNVLPGSEACAAVIGTPLTLSDETQPPDDTQTVVEETQPGGVVAAAMVDFWAMLCLLWLLLWVVLLYFGIIFYCNLLIALWDYLCAKV
ncbi:hypothetical protein LOK49_LG04G02568 [Camellia lanceoleosa]|uniref:Uncharacterized protein n=1 Tax=Camellia lanceoleosa TaxID=1840588 RepID=A0ACC0I4T8_9ERIC|nr:hypothetical protein LOK49_LG04G02568 [Camellia lanceoleosa]